MHTEIYNKNVKKVDKINEIVKVSQIIQYKQAKFNITLRIMIKQNIV